MRPSLMRLMAGVCLLCATALATQDSSPSSQFATSLTHELSPSPISHLQPWLPGSGHLWKRNEGLMLQAAQGIRDESDVEQLDMVQWSTDATKACLQAANSTKPTNEPGIIACYNMPLLMDSKGVFSADIRLIRVVPAVGKWADVSGGYSMGINYNERGAAIMRRNLSDSEVKATQEAMEGSPFELLEHSQYLGQIDMAVLAQSPDDKELQAVLTPDIIVSAQTEDDETLSAEISTEGTKFIIGVFADASKLTDKETDEVQNAKFELPGTRIEIVPAGLYMFIAYMVVGLSIVGWGTLERAKFRDQYRTQLASRGPGGL